MSVTRLDYLEERRKRYAAEAKLSDALQALAAEKAARASDLASAERSKADAIALVKVAAVDEIAKAKADAEARVAAARNCKECAALTKSLSLANDRLAQYGGSPVDGAE